MTLMAVNQESRLRCSFDSVAITETSVEHWNAQLYLLDRGTHLRR